MSCERALLQADGPGWAPPEEVENLRGAPLRHFLAYTRGDKVGLAGSRTELAAFLAPIDDADEALLLVRATSRRVVCDGAPSARRTDRGFEIVTSTGCGDQLREQRVLVTVAGQVSVEEDDPQARSKATCSWSADLTAL